MKSKYTRAELSWAKKICKKIGVDDPRELLEMRYSQLVSLLKEKGLKLVFERQSKPKVVKK